jgi:hypothetical protein
MRTRKIIPIRNFNHKLFAFLAIFALIAFLMTLKPVAEIIKKAVEAVGITFPPIEIFQNTAANLLLFAVGGMLALFAFVVAVPIIKISVTVAAVAIVSVSLYNLYKTFTKQGTNNIMPTARINNK